MSSPGFSGGGASDFFGGAAGFPGRSITLPPNNNNNNNNTPSITTATTNNLHPSHPLYRTQQQLPAIFLDPSSHIAKRQTSPLIGKRTLAEFHNLNNYNNHNSVLSNYLLRSVKPRTFQHGSLSPMDFSISPSEFPNSSGFPSQRFGLPIHHLRPNPVNLTTAQTPLPMNNSILPNTNFPYPNSSLAQVHNRITTHEPEKKMMDHRLQELEKQLLEDNDDEEGDAVSVITNSEWHSETIQSLIAPGQTQTQKPVPVSSSPTSSTTSSNSSSSSVASPASSCSKLSLMEAASAISEGKLDAATEILARLVQASNTTGNSDQRFTDCMVSALKSRINPVENPPPVAELFSKEHAESTQLLFEHSHCFKVAFMAANLAMLEAAFDDENENANNGVKLCVVDFDIGHGGQYANLLHEFSARLNGKPGTVKITAVAENGSGERLKTVGMMLGRQAELLRIGFEFKVVSNKLAELTRESLGCDPVGPLAVNFAFKLYRMPDESVSTENPRDDLLRRVKALAPSVVTLVEQEMNTNTAPFAGRVAESCSYYGALFDSIESTPTRDNSERVKIEEGLSRRLGNSIACEGRDRVERCEVFGKWRARMSMAGFKLKPVSQRVAESIKARLGHGNRVTVREENGGICFGWMGRTITVASAWR
ncbi:scarecrow-like protein 8 [Gastrolobium bilobum]|uniref:scarecrow-like protein 8 n=1 Tax=Gastrolobium bilobum TaxID=150636 RepID=UPI002AB0A93B|nr:scarecrow-like protein 8 [Gastrolobium bilobum]